MNFEEHHNCLDHKRSKVETEGLRGWILSNQTGHLPFIYCETLAVNFRQFQISLVNCYWQWQSGDFSDLF